MIDLSGRSLDGCDFSNAELVGADLSFADLMGAKFVGANLTGANLVGARLIGVDATEANFTDACLEAANLSGATLSACNFKEADLTFASMQDAKLDRASLDGANLHQANLTGADLQDCEFNAIFGSTVLCGVNLHQTLKLGHAFLDDPNHIDHRTIELSARDVTKRDPKFEALHRFIEESQVGGGGVEYLLRLANAPKSKEFGSFKIGTGRRWETETMPERAVDWNCDLGLAVEGLKTLLDQAKSERELQVFLESHPALLAKTLSGGHGRWVIPHLQLGASYEADFLLGERDSAGHHWTLVELESPTEALFTKAGDPAKMLRHAMRQIRDWRVWLADNLALARRAIEDGGMGLFDIDANSKGLIVIGRERDLSRDDRQQRRLMTKESDIRIHTYDYLIDVALSSLGGQSGTPR